MKRKYGMLGMLSWFFSPITLSCGDGDSGGGDSDSDDGFGDDDGDYGLESGYDATTGDVGAGGYDSSYGGGTFGGGEIGEYGGETDADGFDIDDTEYAVETAYDPATGAVSPGGWATESFEGGTVSYDATGSYSVTTADSTYGYDSALGMSYASDFSYGLGRATVTFDDGFTQSFNSLTEAKQVAYDQKLTAAKRAGLSVGALLGPAGMVLGYVVGGQYFESQNPDPMAEYDAHIAAGTVSPESNINATAEQVSTLAAGEAVDFGGDGAEFTTVTTGQVLPTAVEASLSASLRPEFKVELPSEVTRPTTAIAPVDMSKISTEQIEYAKGQQEEWDTIFGSVQTNLSDYYSNLDPDSFAAREITGIQQEYQQTSEQMTRAISQAGMAGSGVDIAVQTQLAQQAAAAKTTARIEAPERVAQQQAGFLSMGLPQQTAIQAGITSAYGTQAGVYATDVAAQTDAARTEAALYGTELGYLSDAARIEAGLYATDVAALTGQQQIASQEDIASEQSKTALYTTAATALAYYGGL